MKESFKQSVKEKAKDWGCKIEDQMAFYHHYNEFRSYRLTTYFVLGFFAFMTFMLLISK